MDRITGRAGAIIYGRSDSTINRGGVRMGTSEIPILSGTPPDQAASRDSLVNPAALDWFAELAR